MSQTFMLDTNIVSYIAKGKSPSSRARLAHPGAGAIACISAITAGELRCGLARTAIAAAVRTAVEGLIAKIQVLDWGRKEALIYGLLRAEQETSGNVLGNLDMLIAAHAVSVGATLVTNDRAFSRVPGLKVENWATEL